MGIKNTIDSGIKKIGFFVLVLVVSACSGPDDRQQVVMAKDYLSQSKVYEAVIELKNALQKNPKNAEARYLLGTINLNLGDIASAEKEFKRAIDAGWPEGAARIGIARAMLVRGALRELLDEVDVKENYPSSVRADLYALHALAQTGLGNREQAEQLIEKATELDVDALYVLKATVLMQFAAGNVAAANESMKRVLARHGDKQEIVLLSALLASNNGERSKALVAYQKVIALEPYNLVTLYGRKARMALARLEILNGNFDQAQSALAPLFKRGSSDPEINYIGGLLAFKQGKLDLAEKYLLQVLQVLPEYESANLLLGFILYEQKKYEQTIYYVNRYVSAVPDNLRARKLLGRAYSRLGQNEKAQAVLQSALKDNSGDVELLALVGLLQLQNGDVAAGVDALENAVRAAPESVELKNKLARAYIFAGKTGSAVKVLNTVLAKGGDKKQAQALLISAYVKAEQHSRAINVVLEMLQEYPADSGVLSLAGNVFESSKNNSEARKYYNRALQITPDYLPAAMFLARLEEIDGNVDKARLMYEKLAQANKKDINSLMALARIASAQNQPEKMVEWLQEAAKRSPQDVESRKTLVEYYLREKQLGKADAVFKELVGLAPDNGALLDLEARLQVAKGQYDEALLSLKKLVNKAPASVYVRTLLAEVYLSLDQKADARRQLDIVLKKRGGYVPALVLMASLELRSARFDKALDYAARLQKIQPDLYAGYELAGDALVKKKDYAAAQANYRRAWQSKPLAGLAIKRSEVLVLAGKLEEATKPLLVWLEDNPGDVRALQSLASIYQSLKQNNKAMRNYEKLLDVQPNNVVALNNLAWLYSLDNNPRALELAKMAARMMPEDSGVQDTYGWILVQQGRAEEGRRILEKVIKDLPDVLEVQYHYAVALLNTGEDVRARKMLEMLLESGKPFEGREQVGQLLN